MSERVREILSCYQSDNPGTLTNLARMLSHGRLGGTGKMVNGRRIIIFSGGPAESDETVLNEVRAIHEGGGFGSIIGRNSFQRKKADALRLLGSIMKIYAGEKI